MTELIPAAPVRGLPDLLPTQRLADYLGVSIEAVELCRSSFFIDLHIDTLIPPRLWGYDFLMPHQSWFGGRFFGHLDVPRMETVGMNAAMWSITTNPFRTARGRLRTFRRNLVHFASRVDANPERLRWVENEADLSSFGGMGVLLSIQGGNALELATDGDWNDLRGRLTRVTLVHLTNSVYGATNAPWHRLRATKGLTAKGDQLVERLNQYRIFVDLAHIHPAGFWRALQVHDPSLPPIVTHTGVQGIAPHWRNIDDEQIKAIADLGGVVGIMAHAGFLKRSGGPKDVRMIAEHIEHVWQVGGAHACSIGTDFDGAIVPPIGFRSGLMYPKLVDCLLRRGHQPQLIQGLLGANFKASFARLRPSGR